MLTTYLLMLATSLALALPQAQDARAEAERLAKSGNHAEALKRFQAIAAANPSDTEARLWIGRLHLEMGEPGRAAAVFDSIVATESQNVEALIGLGRALTAVGRTREASDALSRAEKLAADRVDVLVAQGQLHAAEGRTTLALAYFERAAVLEPTNETIRQAAAAVRAERAHRFETGYDFQHFDTARDDTHTGTFELNMRVNDAFRVFVEGQTHRAFEEFDNRVGGGIEWMPAANVWIETGALFGSENLELPDLDVFGSIVRQGKRAHIGFDLRYADFDGTDFWIGGPTLAIDLTDRATTYFEYHRGRAQFEPGDSRTNDSVTIGFKSLVGQRGSALVEYRHGVDRLDWLTVDRLSAPDANTFSFGAGFDATPSVTIKGRYDFQSRPEDETVQRASARLIFRF
jgi:tetratricopeptide (TPR) repeat protein